MTNSTDPDQLSWICTVCKGRVYRGSAGQGLITTISLLNLHCECFRIALQRQIPVLTTFWCNNNDKNMKTFFLKLWFMWNIIKVLEV